MDILIEGLAAWGIALTAVVAGTAIVRRMPKQHRNETAEDVEEELSFHPATEPCSDLKEVRSKAGEFGDHRWGSRYDLCRFQPGHAMNRMAKLYIIEALDRLMADASKRPAEEVHREIDRFAEACLRNFGAEISPAYLCYRRREAELLRQEELQREAERERIREENKAQAEWRREQRRAEEERKRAERELRESERMRQQAATEEERERYRLQVEELTARLQEAEGCVERAMSMAQQTKCGYVYVISNEGSFGPDVCKIGLTRRLDPQERVDELGDASVPFPFTVHRFIYSDDAPALEAALHRHFADRRVNTDNWRKEFFRVSPREAVEVAERFHF